MVEFPPTAERKRRRWRSLEEVYATLKTPTAGRAERRFAAGEELYARHAIRATFGVHPTRARGALVIAGSAAHVYVGTHWSPICGISTSSSLRAWVGTAGVTRQAATRVIRQAVALQVQDNALKIVVLQEPSAPDHENAAGRTTRVEPESSVTRVYKDEFVRTVGSEAPTGIWRRLWTV